MYGHIAFARKETVTTQIQTATSARVCGDIRPLESTASLTPYPNSETFMCSCMYTFSLPQIKYRDHELNSIFRLLTLIYYEHICKIAYPI